MAGRRGARSHAVRTRASPGTLSAGDSRVRAHARGPRPSPGSHVPHGVDVAALHATGGGTAGSLRHRLAWLPACLPALVDVTLSSFAFLFSGLLLDQPSELTAANALNLAGRRALPMQKHYLCTECFARRALQEHAEQSVNGCGGHPGRTPAPGWPQSRPGTRQAGSPAAAGGGS